MILLVIITYLHIHLLLPVIFKHMQGKLSVLKCVSRKHQRHKENHLKFKSKLYFLTNKQLPSEKYTLGQNLRIAESSTSM